MNVLGRLNTDPVRFFPSPAHLIGGDTPWLRQTRSPLRWFANRSQCVQGLVWLAAAAARDEQSGQIARADFYWNELHARAASLLKAPVDAARQILRTATQVGVSSDIAEGQAAGRLVDELLIDLHSAFHNAYAASGIAHSDQRADFHLRHIRRWLPASGMTPAERTAFMRPLALARVKAAGLKGEWSSAANHWRDLLALDPTDAQAWAGLIETLHAQGAALTEHMGDAARATSAAQALATLCADLESICRRSPDSADAYDALAELHLMRALAQGQAGDVADAMTSAERSLALQPEREDARQLRDAFRSRISDLQVQLEQVEKQLRTRPEYVLNEQGEKLKRQAVIGTSDADLYRVSDDARRVSAAAAHARRRRFWRELGLPWSASTETDPDAMHERLVHAMAQVLERQPHSAGDVARHWAEASAADPTLADLDADCICAFLSHRAFDAPWQPATMTLATVEPLPVPPLPVSTPAAKQHPAGVLPWLYSGQDRWLKFRIAAGIALTTLAFGLGGRETSLLRQRDRAYDAVTAAAAQQDNAATLQAAADYLQIRTFATDPRRHKVLSHYEDALVRWTQAQDDWGTDQQKIVDRYRNLVVREDRP